MSKFFLVLVVYDFMPERIAIVIYDSRLLRKIAFVVVVCQDRPCTSTQDIIKCG